MNFGLRGKRPFRPLPFRSLCLAATLFAAPALFYPDTQHNTTGAISKKASAGCAEKVARLEKFAASKNAGKHQTTRFTEEEVNSYLALELSSKYHPSLGSLLIHFEEPALQGTAVVDFDKLNMNSTKMITRVLAALLSGSHTLTVRGKFASSEGNGNFVLDEARFDGTALPNILVEEIITAVGKKQKPPFDPVTPSTLPYRIQRVEVHRGYIDVYQ
jgi:hypothetical protein